MVNIASGACGHNVLLPVGLGLQCVKELVQTHRHNTKVKNALGQQMKRQNATRSVVQVSSLKFYQI